MESNLAKELKGKFKPIVLIKTNEKPDGALEPKITKHGCIMNYIVQVIVNGKTAVFSKETSSCPGAVSGFGFGNGYDVSEVGLENHAAFLSNGLEGTPNKEEFMEYCSRKPKSVRETFSKGERVFTSYDRAYEFVSDKNLLNVNKEKYVLFKPLEDYDIEVDNTPEGVIFTVNPIELSALLHIDGSIRDFPNFTLTPQASACQAISYHIFNQTNCDDLRGVLGLLDFAGRKNIRRWISDEYMNYSLPWELFLKLEEASYTSIFQSTIWPQFKP